MNPKDGKAGSAVPPTDPKEPLEATTAKPGEVTQVTGGPPPKSHKPPKTKEEKEKKKSWIEIEMVDEEDQPVAGESYRITLSDGETVAEGTLNEKGVARVDGIEPGTCKITFPNLDQDAWEKI